MRKQTIRNLNDISIYKVEVTEDNLQEALDILKLMDMPGWKSLMEHYESARELMVEEQKLNIFTDTEIQHKSRTAILEGCDRILALPLQIKDAVIDMQRKIREEELENAKGQNGTNEIE